MAIRNYTSDKEPSEKMFPLTKRHAKIYKISIVECKQQKRESRKKLSHSSPTLFRPLGFTFNASFRPAIFRNQSSHQLAIRAERSRIIKDGSIEEEEFCGFSEAREDFAEGRIGSSAEYGAEGFVWIMAMGGYRDIIANI